MEIQGVHIPNLGYTNTLGTIVNVSENQMYNYLKQTRDQIKKHPQVVSAIQNPADMLAMYDYQLEHWYRPSRAKAMDILAKKERELIESGELKLNGESEGLFGLIDNLFGWDEDVLFGLGVDKVEREDYNYQYYIDGFGKTNRRKQRKEKREDRKENRQEKREERKENRQEKREDRKENRKEKREERKENRQEKREDRKENRQERREERKKKGVTDKKTLHLFNVANPLAMAARTAFRGLVALNLFGMATIMSANTEKTKKVRENTLNRYYNAGGKKEKLLDAISKGANRKPLMNKELKAEFEKNKNKKAGFEMSGIGELGDPVTLTAVAAASAILIPVAKEVAEAGIAIKEKKEVADENVRREKEKTKDETPKIPDTKRNVENTDESDDSEIMTTDSSGDSEDSEDNDGGGGSTKNSNRKKVGFIVGGLILAGATVYGISKYRKKQNSKPLKKINN